MNADDVLAFLDDFESSGVRCWLDGGWGVDALLGEQTRAHGDMDLVIHRADVSTVEQLLTERGFATLRDWRPTCIAFGHADGREVDLHPIDPTPDGGGDQVLPDGTTWHYQAPVSGTVAGQPVPCCSADEQVAMHTGYELRESDRVDVRHLTEHFGLLPDMTNGPGIARGHSLGQLRPESSASRRRNSR